MMVHTGADALMFGCLLALWQGSPRFEAVFARLKRPLYPALAALVVWIALPQAGLALPRHVAGGFGVTVERFINGVLIAFFMGWLLRHPGSGAGRILNSRVMVHFGILSYSIYLWQTLFLSHENQTWTGKLPWSLCCVMVAAHASYWLVEKPCLTLRCTYARRYCASPGWH